MECGGLRCITAKFRQNWLIAEISRFYDFQYARSPPSSIFKVQILWPVVSGRPICIIVLNFIYIGRTVLEILQFFRFSRRHPSAVVYLFVAYLNHPRRLLCGLYLFIVVQKFDCDRCCTFDNIAVLTFGAFVLKKPPIGDCVEF